MSHERINYHLARQCNYMKIKTDQNNFKLATIFAAHNGIITGYYNARTPLIYCNVMTISTVIHSR